MPIEREYWKRAEEGVTLQACDRCGKVMFRTAVAEYQLVGHIPAEEILDPL